MNRQVRYNASVMPFPRPRRRRYALFFLTLIAVGSFPCCSSVAAAPPFAADRAALIRALPQTALESLPGGFVMAIPDVSVTTPDTDPRFGQRFDRALFIYAPRPNGGLFRTVTFHYGPDEQAQTRRSARLAARLLRLHREHFGRDTAFGRDEETADVWLSAGPAPGGSGVGGETHGSEVYLWAAGTVSRSSLEWTRTLCHEWGHLTLPAARGFSSPEGDAAGYLGERLYQKWLRDDHSSTSIPDDGTNPGDLDLYYRRQIVPLMERWRRQDTGGPNSSLLDGTNTAAMDFYIGAALASDEAFGSALLGRALWTVLDGHPRDFLRSLSRAAVQSPLLTVRLPAWVPLSVGRYMVSSAESGAAGTVAFGSMNLTVLGTKLLTVRVRNTEWRLIRAVHGTVGRISLRHPQVAEDGTQP